ncbi:small conjugating protein ligase-like protein [Calycina marina]|uniref:Small conjugating protein ligase-like protein n=1 Tax=Calycina marina TaxID=1763456 RepID=A0A9P8CEQ7_9HELO|nr:small conjugating protein ligase-like protein [Calycina marina]
MAPRSLSSISAVRKQNLLVEFSSLKSASPQGVFLSLTPGDATIWSGVIFVRKGPYAPSILRFHIYFPPKYPVLAPMVTFSTDVFHPLITPLTTYLYTTDIQDGGLPPGGFSLRHGFPLWFGRSHAKLPTSEPGTASQDCSSTPRQTSTSANNCNSMNSSAKALSTGSSAGHLSAKASHPTIYEVLRYIRSAFDDETVLDLTPLEAAANPGAWHAWRSYRIKAGVILPPEIMDIKSDHDVVSDGGNETNSSQGVLVGYQALAGGTSASTQARRPGEWNWEGVWEVRAKRGIDGSIAESALFGKEAGDDLIRFLKLGDDEVEDLKRTIRSLADTVNQPKVNV